MKLKAALAMLCLAAGAAPAAAVPFQECRDWLETFEIGNVNPAGNDFIDGYAASPDRPVILSRAGDLMEEALHHAAAFYRVTLKLTAPPKLLCVADPDSGEMSYAFVIDESLINPDPNKSVYGDYDAPLIRISPEVVHAYGSMAGGSGAEADPFITPAHELFHAVEAGYRISSICGGCTSSWVDEGLADAFAYAWLRKYERANSGSRTALERGLPRLDHPLHLPADADDAYYRSMFWSYLAWSPKYVYTYRDKKGPSGQIVGLTPKGRFDARLIIRFMNMANTSRDYSDYRARDRQWELEWLDEVLAMALNEAMDKLSIDIPRELKGGLYVIYPKYAAWLVGHLTTGVGHRKRLALLKELFGGKCEVAALTASPDASDSVQVTIAEIATGCVHIKRPEDYENDRVDVTMTAPVDDLHRIHLGWNGGVVPPSVDDGVTKAWRIGLPQGDSVSNPTGRHLFLAISNVAEDISETVAKDDDDPPDKVTINLTIKFAVAGD